MSLHQDGWRASIDWRSCAGVLLAAFLLVMALLGYTIRSTLLPQPKTMAPSAADMHRPSATRRLRRSLRRFWGAHTSERHRLRAQVQQRKSERSLSGDVCSHAQHSGQRAPAAVAEAADMQADADAAVLEDNAALEALTWRATALGQRAPGGANAGQQTAAQPSTVLQMESDPRQQSVKEADHAAADAPEAAPAPHAQEDDADLSAFRPRLEFQMAKIVISYMQVRVHTRLLCFCCRACMSFQPDSGRLDTITSLRLHGLCGSQRQCTSCAGDCSRAGHSALHAKLPQPPV